MKVIDRNLYKKVVSGYMVSHYWETNRRLTTGFVISLNLKKYKPYDF